MKRPPCNFKMSLHHQQIINMSFKSGSKSALPKSMERNILLQSQWTLNSHNLHLHLGLHLIPPRLHPPHSSTHQKYHRHPSNPYQHYHHHPFHHSHPPHHHFPAWVASLQAVWIWWPNSTKWSRPVKLWWNRTIEAIIIIIKIMTFVMNLKQPYSELFKVVQTLAKLHLCFIIIGLNFWQSHLKKTFRRASN